MRVLITGGCGFIGSHLADRLVREGQDVTILDNLSTGKRKNAPREAMLVVGDVADKTLMYRLVAENELVFHLAGAAAVEACQNEWLDTHRSNLTGTITVFDASSKAGGVPVVYASSAAVYGDCDKLPLLETAPTNPLSAYGVDKLSAERYGQIAWRHHKVPNTGLRFFNVYGPRQDPASPYSGVISKFFARATARRPLQVFGDGEQTRDFIYVGDIVDLLLKGGTAAGGCEVFNGCTGERVSVNQLATLIGKITGNALPLEHLSAREGDIRHSVGSPLKAQNILDFAAHTKLETGLRALFAAEAAAHA